MSTRAETVTSYWTSAEARDWAAHAATLAADVVYEAPQTRERVRGRDGLVAYNSAFPGDWHVTLTRVVVGDDGAVTRVGARVGDEPMTGICFFTFDADGLIRTVEDYWPEPYDLPESRRGLAERY